MRLCKNIQAFSILLILSTLVAVQASVTDDWAFGSPPDYLEQSLLCGALSQPDLTAPDHFAAIEAGAGIELMRELASRYPDLALAVMMLIPVDGWVQSFGAKGEFEAYIAFEPGAVDLSPVIERLGSSPMSSAGLSLQAVENVHSDLQAYIEDKALALPNDEALEIRGQVRVSMTGRKELVLSSERQRFDSSSGQGVAIDPDKTVQVVVTLSDEGVREVPVLSSSGLQVSAPLHTIDSIRIMNERFD